MKLRFAGSVTTLALTACLSSVPSGAPDDDTFLPALLPDARNELSLNAPTRLTLLNFNILHGLTNEDADAEPWDRLPERLNILKSELARVHPDIVVLQEVFLLENAGAYPDVLAAVQEVLRDEQSKSYPALFGSYQATTATLNSGTGAGQMTLAPFAFDSTTIGTIEPIFPGTNRMILHVRYQTPIGIIDVFNAHLAGHDEYEEGLEEMEKVLTFLDSASAPNAVVQILAGDLNTEENEKQLDVLTAAGFRDLGGEAGLTCAGLGDPGCTSSTTPLGMPGSRATRRIDFIWARTQAPLTFQTEMIFNAPADLGNGEVLWPSDHVGLVTHIIAPTQKAKSVFEYGYSGSTQNSSR